VKTPQKWDIGEQEADMIVIARISNLLGKITMLVMVGLCVNTALALDGSGTQEDPWRIKSLEDFNDFAADANYWDNYTRLETDVNLAGMVYERAVIAPDVDDAELDFQGTMFTGVFDGNNHTISNFKYDCNEVMWVGVFGYISGANTEIKNLGLIDPNVNAGTGRYVGSLVGSNLFGTIINCYVKGARIVGDNHVGGLVGGSRFGTITNCYSTGDVTGFLYVGGLVGSFEGTMTDCYSRAGVSGTNIVGGLVGWNGFGSITNSYSTGSVIGVHDVGGLVGWNFDSPITNCYSTGSVIGERYVGGLVGWNQGESYSKITYCCSTGSVMGDDNVGGLVGLNDWGSITKSYSTGSVIGEYYVGGLVGWKLKGTITDCYSSASVLGYARTGGLVGINDGGSVSNCYSISDVNGLDACGGLLGLHGSNSSVSNCFWDTDTQTHGVTESIGYPGGTITNVLGLPTTQLHQQSTFTDWDFINVWNIGENQTYPYLRIYLTGDINKDGIVNFLDVAITANQWMQAVE
jgi:hypothetical protein